MASYPWFTEAFVNQTIDSFLDHFESALEYWRKEYATLDREHQDLSAKNRKEGPSSQDRNRIEAIAQKLNNMREGEKDFYIYRYLSAQGFLPNYGFPSSNIVLSLSESENEIQRDNVIALSEFAPGNTIYLPRRQIPSRLRQTKSNEPKTRQRIPANLPQLPKRPQRRNSQNRRGMSKMPKTPNRRAPKPQRHATTRHVRNTQTKNHKRRRRTHATRLSNIDSL